MRTLTAAPRQPSCDGCEESLQGIYRTADLPAIRLRLCDLHEDLVSDRLGVCLILLTQPCSGQLAKCEGHSCRNSLKSRSDFLGSIHGCLLHRVVAPASCAPWALPMITGP